ncbi:polyketide synthase dehydratase domain-containing protein, partial [Bradyrhizobium sp. Leaf401]|uniref:polyketide synthase dehydratase domain-containing protein n=1 Tax=Bradyrhizobium sp. Leaf401 TaxID=2876564 RepID=UPI001E55F9D0
TGEEFFLADHVVGGARVLPGVAYLEMVRAAVARSAALAEGEEVQLRHVAWLRPIVAGADAVEVHVELLPEEDGAISFEVVSGEEDSQAGPVVHASGQVVVGAAGQAAALDVSRLRGGCERSMTAEECYELYRAMGISYGPAHRGVETIGIGRDGEGRPYVLAQIAVPAGISDTQDQYVLHPTLIDSALHASIGLMAAGGTAPSGMSSKPRVPFALDELAIVRAPSGRLLWSYARLSAE